VIRQGEVFWLELAEAAGSAPSFRHPHVVVQNDIFNLSKLATTVVCTLTTNLKRAQAPGNVLLGEGEAGLPRRSVVNVTQIYTVDKDELVERLGTLSVTSLGAVIDGLALVLEPRELPPGSS